MMKTLYKITDSYNMSFGNTKWGRNISYTLPKKKNPRFCTSDIFHAYEDPNLAVLFKHIHSNYAKFNFWVAEGDPVLNDGVKVGCFKLKTIKRIPTPKWYTSKKRSVVAIKLARALYMAIYPIFKDIPLTNRKYFKLASNVAKKDYVSEETLLIEVAELAVLTTLIKPNIKLSKLFKEIYEKSN